MKKATIYDYARMCKFHKECANCPLIYKKTHCESCNIFIGKNPDKANEIILKWCEEHPVETRQDRLLKMFPHSETDNDGVLVCCPKWVDKDFRCDMSGRLCTECRKEYWLAEVDENE